MPMLRFNSIESVESSQSSVTSASGDRLRTLLSASRVQAANDKSESLSKVATSISPPSTAAEGAKSVTSVNELFEAYFIMFSSVYLSNSRPSSLDKLASELEGMTAEQAAAMQIVCCICWPLLPNDASLAEATSPAAAGILQGRQSTQVTKETQIITIRNFIAPALNSSSAW